MTDAEMRIAHRRDEMELLRALEREVYGGKIVRNHDQVRRMQSGETAGESLVASDSGDRLTHDQALERLRSERIRAAAHLRPRVSAKGRQQIHGGTK